MNLLGDNGFVCFLYGYVLFPGTDYGCWYMLPFCMVHRREYILHLMLSAVALAISILNFLLFPYLMVYICYTGGSVILPEVEMLQ